MSDEGQTQQTLAERAAALRTDVIEPVLASLSELSGRELGGEAAVQLLLATAVHESGGLVHRRQLSGGPALGLYQMEPATHDDIWMNFLSSREDLDSAMRSMFTPAEGVLEASLMEIDDGYATAMARVHYLRARAVLPPAGDLDKIAAYWKRNYNTPAGRGTPEAFIASQQGVLPA
jgi:hypothetical protein